MKKALKTIISSILLLSLLVLPINVLAISSNATFETELETESRILKPGEEFEVSVNIKNFSNIGKGLISLAGQLEYDTNILDIVAVGNKFLTGQNGWDLDAFNKDNFKFVTDNNKFITEAGDIFKIKFKVKSTISQDIQTLIKIVKISASGGNGIVVSDDTQLNINIKTSQNPSNPDDEKFTSEKYVIDDQYISRITSGTTVNQFKQNIETNQTIEIIDKKGNTLGENSVIATGMTLKVGSTSLYIISVTGDIDEDGEITINDLAKLKLHYVGIEQLTGVKLKAADLDDNSRITINDVSILKLVLVGLTEIE